MSARPTARLVDKTTATLVARDSCSGEYRKETYRVGITLCLEFRNLNKSQYYKIIIIKNNTQKLHLFSLFLLFTVKIII